MQTQQIIMSRTDRRTVDPFPTSNRTGFRTCQRSWSDALRGAFWEEKDKHILTGLIFLWVFEAMIALRSKMDLLLDQKWRAVSQICSGERITLMKNSGRPVFRESSACWCQMWVLENPWRAALSLVGCHQCKMVLASDVVQFWLRWRWCWWRWSWWTKA